MPVSETSVMPSNDASPVAPARPTVTQAFLVLAAVVIAIAGYIAISSGLALREAYVGYLFVFYWMSFEKGNARGLPPVVLGASFGLAATWLLQFAPHSPHPTLMIAVFLVAVSVSIMGLVLGWLPYVFNLPAMLMLTVFASPPIQQEANFPQVYLALAFAVIYFSLLVIGGTKLAAVIKPR